MLYCECFSLAIGEDVYDLRLPSASRIPDMHVTVWISWQFSIFGFPYITLYITLYLSVLRTTTVTLVAQCHPPPSPFSSCSFFCCIFCVFVQPGRPHAQFRSPGACRGCLSATTLSGEAALAHKHSNNTCYPSFSFIHSIGNAIPRSVGKLRTAIVTRCNDTQRHLLLYH